MAYLNKVMCIGNVGKDPEVRYMPDGKSVTNISVACTERYKTKEGEQKELTEWINCVFFGKLADIVSEYVKKGSSIYVEGKLKTDRYTDKNTGAEKFSTKVVGEFMQLLGIKGELKTGEKPSKPRNSDLPPEFEGDVPF